MVVPLIAMEALSTSMGGLMSAVGSLKDKLSDLMAFADKAQQASLAIGMSYQQSSSALKPSIDNLRGSIENRFSAGLRTLEAGLQGNTVGVAKLINQQELTGTQFAKTATTFAKLEAGLGLSREQTNNLSENLITTGNKWGISTDKLVNALESMKDSLPFQKLAGWGDKFAGSITELQGMLGPQFGTEVNQMMRMITDTSLEGMRKLAVLGIGDIRQRISNAKDQEEVTRLLVETIKKANQSVKALIGPGGSFEGGGAALEYAAGRSAIVFNTLSDNLNKRVLNPMEVNFANTMQTLKKEIWVPLQELFAEKVYPELLRFTEYFSKISKTIVQVISDTLENSFEGTSDFINKILIGLIDVTIGMVEGVESLIGGAKVFNSILTYLYDYIPGTPDEYIKKMVREGHYDLSPEGARRRRYIEPEYEMIKNPEWVKIFGSKDATGKNPIVTTLTNIRNELMDLNGTANKIKQYTGRIGDNTEPEETTPSYLKESTDILENAVRGILGVGGINYLEEISDLTKQLIGATEEQTTTLQDGVISNNLAAAVSRA
jgi:hypothetical protein